MTILSIGTRSAAAQLSDGRRAEIARLVPWLGVVANARHGRSRVDGHHFLITKIYTEPSSRVVVDMYFRDAGDSSSIWQFLERFSAQDWELEPYSPLEDIIDA